MYPYQPFYYNNIKCNSNPGLLIQGYQKDYTGYSKVLRNPYLRDLIKGLASNQYSINLNTLITKSH